MQYNYLINVRKLGHVLNFINYTEIGSTEITQGGIIYPKSVIQCNVGKANEKSGDILSNTILEPGFGMEAKRGRCNRRRTTLYFIRVEGIST